MEQFKLVTSEWELYHNQKRYLEELGWPEWKVLASIGEEPAKPEFPKLSDKEEEIVQVSFSKRKELLEKYKELRERILPLIAEEGNLWQEFSNVSKEICAIEGHRLSSGATVVGGLDAYGYYEDDFRYYTCLVCGKHIGPNNKGPKDVNVIGESDIPEKIFSSITLKRKK